MTDTTLREDPDTRVYIESGQPAPGTPCGCDGRCGIHQGKHCTEHQLHTPRYNDKVPRIIFELVDTEDVAGKPTQDWFCQRCADAYKRLRARAARARLREEYEQLQPRLL